MAKSEIPTTMTKKKKLGGRFILPALIVAVITISITATFIHNNLQEKSIQLEKHLTTYKPMIDSRDSSHSNLLDKLKNRQISIDDFYKNYNLITKKYKSNHNEYLIVKKKLKADQAILGYTSFKNLALSVGIRFFVLIVSLFYFSSKIKQHYESKNQKKFYLIISSSFVLTSAYWFTWSLIYKVNSIGKYDFEQWHQNILLLVAPILILASSHFLFKHYQTIEERLKKVISILFDQILYVIPEKGYVKREKENEYTKLNSKVIIEVGKEINK